MNEFTPTLNIAIKNLYKVFSHYPHEKIEGCPCCVKKDDNKKLISKPLKELTPADLSKYAFKALTTWGDENNFKHFLPRIFELIARHELITDSEVVFGKLDYANWQSWSKKEQDAIKEFFRELVKYAIEFDKEKAYITAECISAIAVAVEDITPYLALWQKNPTRNKIITLHYFIIDDEFGSMNPWLAGLPEKRKQIVSWLTDPKTIEYFENLFFEDQDFQNMDELAETIDRVNNLKEVS